MADFASYPALDVAPPPNLLDMAGKVAALHQTLLQNTGMGLDQHMTRLASLARMAAVTLNPDGTADPTKFADVVNSAVKLGLIQPSDGANAMLTAPKDPSQLGDFVRGQIATAQKSLDAIAPHIQYASTGSGAVPYNDNAFSAGGVTAPGITYGLSPADKAAAVTVTNQDLSTTTDSGANTARRFGVNPDPTFTSFGPQGVAPPAPIAQSAVPPSPQQTAQDTIAAIGGNQLTTPQSNKMGPITIGAGAKALVDQNVAFRNKDIAEGTDPSIPISIGNLQGIVAASDAALTGPGSTWRADTEKILQSFGVPFPSTGATDRDIMDKEQNMLAQQLGTTGSPTDAAAVQMLHTTPGGSMTPDSIKATAALTLGLLKYKVALAKAAQGASDPTTYNQVRGEFIAKNPTPLMYALPSMPKAQQKEIWTFVSKLPAAEKTDFVTKYQMVGP